MTTVPQLIIVLLLIRVNFSLSDKSVEYVTETQKYTTENVELLETIKDITTEISIKNIELVENQAVPTVTSLKVEEPKDDKITYAEDRVSESTNSALKEFVEIILKDNMLSINGDGEIKNTADNSTKYIVKEKPKSLNNVTASINSNESDELENQKVKNFINKNEIVIENSTESLIKVIATTAAEYDLTPKPLTGVEATKNSTLVESGLIQIVLQNVNNLTTKRNEFGENFTKSLLEIATNTSVEFDLTTKSFISLEKPENLNFIENSSVLIVLEDVKNSTNEQEDLKTNLKESLKQLNTSNSVEYEMTQRPFLIKDLAEDVMLEIVLRNVTNLTSPEEVLEKNFKESFLEIINTTSPEYDETTAKPSISLEEYAVRQMNFILDHLLMETQDFVAKVLQATINSVYPRDHLKRYAESLNSLLNPGLNTDYSYEDIEDIKINTPDDIYEEIIQKINFLKSKPSKYLQKILPEDWLNDYRIKREELVIWVDKATEQMHKEFNCYITEEVDHIKYQYFNETFDDITRATEIHHKLALLVDLVNIVKNKKQITFMDLYMQT